jgi:hypothetical protein
MSGSARMHCQPASSERRWPACPGRRFTGHADACDEHDRDDDETDRTQNMAPMPVTATPAPRVQAGKSPHAPTPLASVRGDSSGTEREGVMAARRAEDGSARDDRQRAPPPAHRGDEHARALKRMPRTSPPSIIYAPARPAIRDRAEYRREQRRRDEPRRRWCRSDRAGSPAQANGVRDRRCAAREVRRRQDDPPQVGVRPDRRNIQRLPAPARRPHSCEHSGSRGAQDHRFSRHWSTVRSRQRRDDPRLRRSSPARQASQAPPR